MLLAQVGWLEREETNVKDRNAILVKCAPPGGILGYLPRKIAQHLSQLLQRQQIGSEVVVTKLPIKSTSPVDIQLQVTVLSLCPQTCIMPLQAVTWAGQGLQKQPLHIPQVVAACSSLAPRPLLTQQLARLDLSSAITERTCGLWPCLEFWQS